MSENDPSPRTPSKDRPASDRLVSVDALRGFDMFWIVGAGVLFQAASQLNQTPSASWVNAQLDHVAWEGFAFLDLIFPLFVFLSGMSVVFSLSRVLREKGLVAAYRRILVRTVLLYIIGVFYYDGVSKPWPDVRLLGVLQRIAICSGIAGILFCHFRWKGLLAIFGGILVGYWAILTFVPVPGIGAGVFEPGKNLANYIDSVYLPGRKWDITWDPEGLLSTMPAVATCILGVFAALWLRKEGPSGLAKVGALVLAGAVLAGVGWLWGLQFPVIKKIWTSSYVLVAGGYSLMLLGAFSLILDVMKFRAWATPFIWIGSNPLAIYMADDLINFEKVARRIAGGDVHAALGKYGDLVLCVVGIACMLALARFLYTRKIFLRA
jgi:predicted acyltransferase